MLLDGPTSEPTKEGIIRRLTLRKKHVLTLTSDNGKVFPGHSEISEKLGSSFYFCAPYHSWERGLNKNTNGLVRQHFPKSRDFAKSPAADVQRVRDLLNNRPVKVLNYHQHNQVFAKFTALPKIYALGM